MAKLVVYNTGKLFLPILWVWFMNVLFLMAILNYFKKV